MSIDRHEVVYRDTSGDVISATPSHEAHGGFVCHGAVSMMPDAHFGTGRYSRPGGAISVSVRPGDELSLAASIADRLRRATDADRTVVATVETVTRRARDLGLDPTKVAELLEVFTTAGPPVDQASLV
jgi:hypothetical protein